MIRVRDLGVRFPGRTLRFPDFDLAAGEHAAIVGPNGSGKTTLLRVLAGLLEPSSGSRTGVPPRGRTVLVHQEPYFFRGTVRENLEWAQRLGPGARAPVEDWIEQVGATGLTERTAQDLSVGERRRLAIARALCVEPQLLLLDEPFASLDDAGRQGIAAVIRAFEGILVLAAPRLPLGWEGRGLSLGSVDSPGVEDLP